VTEYFGLPRRMFERGVKRWGFHGLSYESIIRQFRKLEPQLAAGRVIVAQLGNGASLCAMKGGRSVDTTTGFSTLDGLPTAAGCGSLDPGVILYLLQQMTLEQLQELLFTQSGLLGVSGLSGDMSVLQASHDPHAIEAVDYFVYRIIREIGSLTAVLGGLDALIFSAPSGADSSRLRTRICKGLAWLGAAVETGANERSERCISAPGHSPSIWTLSPDEDGVIAAYTCELVSKLPNRVRYPRGGGDAAFRN
jgi:acetate kinase